MASGLGRRPTSLRRCPPRSAKTVVKIVGTPNALAFLPSQLRFDQHNSVDILHTCELEALMIGQDHRAVFGVRRLFIPVTG